MLQFRRLHLLYPACKGVWTLRRQITQTKQVDNVPTQQANNDTTEQVDALTQVLTEQLLEWTMRETLMSRENDKKTEPELTFQLWLAERTLHDLINPSMAGLLVDAVLTLGGPYPQGQELLEKFVVELGRRLSEVEGLAVKCEIFPLERGRTTIMCKAA